MDLRKCREEMDHMISACKNGKKDWNSEDSDKYGCMLTQLLESRGLSDDAFEYISGATKIGAIDAFVVWLGGRENPHQLLKGFLKNKKFENSKQITADIIFSALRSILENKTISPNCASTILETLPALCKNKKDGKWAKILPSTFYNKFSSDLSKDVTLPDFKDLGLKGETISALKDMAENIYEKLPVFGYDSSVPRQKKVLEWLGVEYPPEKDKENPVMIKADQDGNKNGHKESVPVTTKKAESGTTAAVPDSGEKKTAAQSEIKAKSDSADKEESSEKKFRARGENLQTLLREYTEQGVAFLERINYFEQELSKLKESVIRHERVERVFREQKDALSRTIEEKDQEIVRLAEKAKGLETEYERFKKEIDKKFTLKDEDIERYRQEIKEREHQKDVTRKRLETALKSVYQDFTEVQDAPMNSDLGDAMRASLEGIFQILRENDIDPGKNS